MTHRIVLEYTTPQRATARGAASARSAISNLIPSVDVSPILSAGFASPAGRAARDALGRACAETGFVRVVGHGVDPDLRERALDAATRFFELPIASKLSVAARRWNPASPNVYRGFFPSSANGKEGLDIGEPRMSASMSELLSRPYCELNRYPAELGSDWQLVVSRYFDALFELGGELMRSMVSYLGGVPARVAAGFARPRSLSTLRFNFYPGHEEPVARSPDDGAPLSCETHVDSGIVTLLVQDTAGGLEVRDRTGRWCAVPFDADAFVVNTGSALERISGGAFAATPHRVRFTRTRRLSIPFFFEPVDDFEVSGRSLGLPDSEGALSYEAFLTKSLAKFAEYDRAVPTAAQRSSSSSA